MNAIRLLLLATLAATYGWLASPAAQAAKPAKFSVVKEAEELVLFDAAIHDVSAIRNYTASWQKGSDLTPVVTRVVKGGETFAAYAFRGKRGSACSTFWFQSVPAPAEGTAYGGLRFTIGYDRADFAKVSVKACFSDGTSVTAPLTLEPGRKDYVLARGFRRSKDPIAWGALSYLWLSASAGGKGNPLTFRLKRIAMVHRESEHHAAGPAVAVPDRFGERLFNPRLKRVRWKDGEFPARRHARLYLDTRASARTRRTAALFAEKYYTHTGVKLETLPLADGRPRDGIALRVADTASCDGRQVKPRREGYCLIVEKNRVLITGFDEPGLYYGDVTFFQLMKNSMRIQDHMPVPCVEVYDWPDLPHRLVSLQGTSAFKNQKPKDDLGIEYMMEWTDRFVAGQKANVLFWDLSSRVRYKRRPEFNGAERVHSLEDLKRFGQFCRDRFVEVCPAWQIGGHADWWLLGYHPELREKGYARQADVTHPDHNRIVFDCMLDVVEALECKYLSPKSDEWWTLHKKGETPDALLNGKTRAEAFLDFHIQLNTWLARRGITMLMYHDMLTPYHNGTRHDLYTIVDRFPKNVIINYWGGYDIEKGIAFLAERGFPIWLQVTGSMIRLGEKEKRTVQGAGKILYSHGNDKAGGLLDEYSDFYNLYASFRLLDYAWNLFDYAPPKAGRATAVKNIMALKPNSRAAEKVEPVDISGALTQSFNALLRAAKPEDYGKAAAPVTLRPGTREIGHIPTRFEPNEQGNCVWLRKGDKAISLPVDAACSSLIFLHTAFIDDPKDRGARAGMGRYWLYGWPCGDYIVHYEDGETQKLPVRLSMNIRRFDASAKNRATNDNRYVHTVRDTNGNPLHLFQWEWVNPRPEKKIASVSVKHDGQLDVSLILFALSGRRVWPGE
ncbi:hypothetical protein HQ560_08635 [bacterium]|nr:hypothetical protein [bacterium]